MRSYNLLLKKRKLFMAQHNSSNLHNRSIWLLDGTLSDTTIQGQTRPGRNVTQE